jgi:hypothetical protein
MKYIQENNGRDGNPKKPQQNPTHIGLQYLEDQRYDPVDCSGRRARPSGEGASPFFT